MMTAKQIVKEVPYDGTLHIRIPEYSGQKIKVIYFPATEETDDDKAHLDFVTATYLAAIEDDEEEDAVWEKYIK